eukprot:scaffold52896_cov34-Prasinocladus_malaysianus.AAC.1
MLENIANAVSGMNSAPTHVSSSQPSLPLLQGKLRLSIAVAGIMLRLNKHEPDRSMKQNL